MLTLHDGFFWQVGIDNVTPMFASNCGGYKWVTLLERYVDYPTQPINYDDFMISSHNGWDTARVREVFTPDDAEHILNYLIANMCSDLLVWGNHSSGTYEIEICLAYEA
ncbi:hypothetical protein V6N12_042452 [Hibiscus sabdariffa]|uniref:Uncharacterized protein n=1 Tax=Hibiscus sabdariffa TaxID=183260 RepID=A0ABR2EF78_9ROSI